MKEYKYGVYEGELKNDKREGKGIMYYKEENIINNENITVEELIKYINGSEKKKKKKKKRKKKKKKVKYLKKIYIIITV